MKLCPFDRRPRRWCAPAEARSRRSRRRKPAVLSLEERRLLSINIAIDYSFDTNHFFDSEGKRYLIEQAANILESALGNDHLAATAARGSSSGAASSPDPATGEMQTIANPPAPADTIIIYVG